MSRVMALDVGDVRIGVAVSDSLQMIANPLETYTRKGDERDLRYFSQLAAEKEAETFVCGLPRNLKGEETLQTEKVRRFAEQLQSFTSLPVVFFDERLTTVSAERVLLEGNVRRENRKKVIDKVAAAIILQNYLDSRKR